MGERVTSVSCVICGKSVPLVECKVSDLGEPVHELCYAEKLKEEIEQRMAVLDRLRA